MFDVERRSRNKIILIINSFWSTYEITCNNKLSL